MRFKSEKRIMYQFIKSEGQFIAGAERWNELVENGVTRHTYLRHEWFQAWWRAFGKDKEISIVIVLEDDRWMAIAPLCVARKEVGPFKLRSLQFMYSGIGPRCEFILREERADINAILLKGILSIPVRWSICYLEAIPFDAPTYRLLPEALRQERVIFNMCYDKTSPYIVVHGTWDEYLSKLSNNCRHNMRKTQRKTENLGKSVFFARITEHDQIMGYLPKLFDVSAGSWKKEIGTDMGVTAASRRFYHELSDNLSLKSRLIIWALELDGEPVAFQYALFDGKTAVSMRTDFLLRYAQAGVGTALQGHILNDCFERGITEFDFAGAAYTYKERLSSNKRAIYSFEIYPARLFPLLLCAIRRLLRRIRSILNHKKNHFHNDITEGKNE